MIRRGTATAVIGMLVWLVATLAFAPSASAHAGLVSSDPAGGATLASSPTAVTLTFTEAPDPSLSSVQVLNAAGASMDTGALSVSGPKQLSVALPTKLPDGTYTVSWRVVSQEDGHLTAGTFAFGVGTAPLTGGGTTGATTTTPRPSVLGVTGKVLLYAGLALMLGTVVTGLFAFGGHVPARRRLLPAAGLAGLAGAIVMVAAERNTIGVSYAALLRSSTGEPLIWLAVGAAATATGAVWAAREPGRGALAAAGIAAAVTMYTRAEGGHAASSGWPEIALQWVHFVAMGVWIGGLVPVLLLLRERRRAGDATPVGEVAAYSSMAGWALLAVVLTGSLRAVNELGGWDAVLHAFRTSYGTALAIKVAVVLVLVALGAANRYRSIPRLGSGDGALRRLMTAEVAGAVGVFALTGVLTGLPPNPAPAASQAPSRVTASASDFATTMKVTLTATPGAPGTNAFVVRVDDYDTGAPLKVSAVSLRFTPVGRPDVAPSELDLVADGDAWSGRGANLSLAGSWNVVVTVQQGARATEVPLTLATRAPDQQVAVSSPVPGQPTLYTITLPGGLQLQAYNDPGTAGPNQLHLTAFDANGRELPLASATIVATPAAGSARALDVSRFGPGHFVGSVALTPGDWHFDLSATARDGAVLTASFDQTIGGT